MSSFAKENTLRGDLSPDLERLIDTVMGLVREGRPSAQAVRYVADSWGLSPVDRRRLVSEVAARASKAAAVLPGGRRDLVALLRTRGLA